MTASEALTHALGDYAVELRRRMHEQREAMKALESAISADIKDARAIMLRMKHLGLEYNIAEMEEINTKPAPRAKKAQKGRKTGGKTAAKRPGKTQPAGRTPAEGKGA